MGSSVQDIYKEIRRKAAMQPRVKNLSHEVAIKGLNHAIDISPVETGEFRDAWGVRDFPPRFEGDLPMSQLQNSDDGAVSIEYGTARTPPHGTMAATKVYMESIAADMLGDGGESRPE